MTDAPTAVELVLFVAGDTTRSVAARRNLQRLIGRHGDGFRVEIVDVLTDAGRADEFRIVATPTLIRLAPDPVRRVVGDLSDLALVALVLDLDPVAGSPEET